MRKSLLEIYALLICAITGIFVLVYLHQGIYNGVLLLTKKDFSYENDYYTNNASYTKSWQPEQYKKYTDDQITQMRANAKAADIRSGIADKKSKMVEAAIYVVLASAFFGAHWYIAKKERRKCNG